MNGERLLNFFEFYLEDENEDITEVEKVLTEAGVNVESSEKRVFELIGRAKAEIKIKRGEELQKRFDEALKQNEKEAGDNASVTNYALAARNFEGLAEDDLKLIRENMEALERIKSKK